MSSPQLEISPATPDDDLPLFDGFPYLVTRLVRALYHVTLLPGGAPESTLLELARRQVAANCLDTCLVFDAARGVFFYADGRVTPSRLLRGRHPPRRGPGRARCPLATPDDLPEPRGPVGAAG